ncbi:MAG: hypothetical protein AB1815_06480 [Bacillota bacterium]
MRAVITLLIAFTLILSIAGYAVASPGEPVEQTVTEGIQPVSPDELAGKVSGFLNSLHSEGKPFVATLAKIIIAFSGLLMLVAIFTGFRVLAKVFAAVLAAGLGLFLYNNADTVVALYLWFSNHFARG